MCVRGGGEGPKLNHSGLMLEMCLLYAGMSLAEKELTIGSNCSGKQKDIWEFLKVQLSEIASLTDTDRKIPSQYFPSYIPVYVFIFFHFDHVRLRDEEKVCAIITKLQGYVELNGSRSEICRVYLRHIEHLYYKVNNILFNKY